MKPGFTFYVWYVYSRSLRWHHIIFPKQWTVDLSFFYSRKYKRVALLCIKAEEKRVRVTHHVKTSCAGPPFIRLQDKSLGLGTLHKTVDLSPPLHVWFSALLPQVLPSLLLRGAGRADELGWRVGESRAGQVGNLCNINYGWAKLRPSGESELVDRMTSSTRSIACIDVLRLRASPRRRAWAQRLRSCWNSGAR